MRSIETASYPQANHIVQGSLCNKVAFQADHKQIHDQPADAIEGDSASNEHQPSPGLKLPQCLQHQKDNW